jgi:hypothetical protein
VNRGLVALLLAQALLFIALPWTGSQQAWGVFCSFNIEIADALLSGGSPWDQYDGLVAGPMAMAVLEGPLLAVLGRSPWVHILTTLGIALSATALTWFAVRRLGTPRAAFLAAALVAFPPPNTWYHQHQGAYHLLGMLGMPLALLLLGRAGSKVNWGRETAGWLALAGGVSLAPGGIGPAAAIGGGMWLLRVRSHRRAALLGLAPAAIGTAIASLPLIYKAKIHTPFAGLANVASEAVAQQTKPFFLGIPKPWEVPGKLWTMLADQLPYGLHFGAAGVPLVGGAFVLVAIGSWLVLVRRRDTSLLPLLLVPPAALTVGLITGWFVIGHAPDQEPFPRDARHILVLTFFLSWIVGLTLDRLRWAWAGPAIVAVFVAASLGTQVSAMGPSQGPPFRMESRFIQGFFAGPVLGGQPEGAAAWCDDGPRRWDCLRGVAMSWGHRYAAGDYGLRGAAPDGGPSKTPGLLRGQCRSLSRAAHDESTLLRESCFFGLGFGFSDQALRRIDRGIETCDSLELRENEHSACIRGVGWGQAQNFWNRPGAVKRWVDEQTTGAARVDSASGVGILVAMLAVDRDWVQSQCAAQVPADVVSACLQGAASNERFMPTEER